MGELIMDRDFRRRISTTVNESNIAAIVMGYIQSKDTLSNCTVSPARPGGTVRAGTALMLSFSNWICLSVSSFRHFA